MTPPRRVLLVGRVTDRARRRTGFPELRTESFRRALVGAGHDVVIAGLVPPGEEGEAPEGIEAVGEEAPGWLDAIDELAADREVIVAAGPYNAGRAACLVAGERPVWVDVPGDPFAEVETAARAQGRSLPERQAAAQAAFLPVLGRADGLGAVSAPQRRMLQGQLGLLGRLAHPDGGPAVDCVPVAWCFEQPPRPPRARAPGAPPTVLLSGAFNAWLDEGALQQALDALLVACPDARVRVTGGAAPGHHDAGAAAFAAWADDRPQVTLLGRLSAEALAAEAASAHLGLLLDGPGLEPETGSRTRVLFWLHQGLQVVASTTTPLCRELADAGWVRPPLPSPGEALVAAVRAGADTAAVAAAQDALAARYAPAAVAAPLLHFVAAPRRHAPVEGPWQDLAREHAALADALRAVHASPTWRLLAPVHGVLRDALRRLLPGDPDA